jgi:hypothetical protein
MTQDEFGTLVSRLFAPACDKAYNRGAAEELQALRQSLGPKTRYTAEELDQILEERVQAVLARAEVTPVDDRPYNGPELRAL